MTKTSPFKRYAATLLVALAALFTLTGCEEDDWWATDNIIGQWRVVEAGGYERSPYQYGDRFRFYSGGNFEVRGSGGLYESGYWEVSSRRVLLYFQQTDYPEISAYISQMDEGYMTLRVTDNSYNMSYTLRLVRDEYY